MIGPPGLPKVGRRVFSFVRNNGAAAARHRWCAAKWVVGLYFAGVGGELAFPAVVSPPGPRRLARSSGGKDAHLGIGDRLPVGGGELDHDLVPAKEALRRRRQGAERNQDHSGG